MYKCFGHFLVLYVAYVARTNHLCFLFHDRFVTAVVQVPFSEVVFRDFCLCKRAVGTVGSFIFRVGCS